MKKTASFFLCATAALLLPLASGSAHAGECSNANLTKAIREVTGREPQGQGVQGACDPSRYPLVLEKGVAPTYQQIKEKVGIVMAVPAKPAVAQPASVRTRGVTAERCFGAVGNKCDGVPVVAARNGNTLKVSVGSILHDNCCLANPGGKMCSGPVSQVRHNGQCVREWDKAVWNSFYDGRHWDHPFDPQAIPDLTWVSGRPFQFQGAVAPIARGGHYETRATAQLKAPAGTALDVGDQAFCASGRAREYNVWGTPKRWIVCQ